MLILLLQLGLATKQVDYTSAFLHAPIEEDVYVEMPRGFWQEGNILKLKWSLYGLKQALRNFFKHLHAKLLKLGFKQSETNPVNSSMTMLFCLTYVDGCLFFSPAEKYIDDMIVCLQDEHMKLKMMLLDFLVCISITDWID